VVQRRAMRDPARSSHSRPGCPPRLLMRPHSGSRSNAASRPSRILEYRPTPGGSVPDIAGTEPVGRPAQASRATATVFGMIYCRVGGFGWLVGRCDGPHPVDAGGVVASRHRLRP
jgi:hypothetical protein